MPKGKRGRGGIPGTGPNNPRLIANAAGGVNSNLAEATKSSQ